MEHNVILAVILILIICLLTMLSNKIKVAYPILLILAGLLLGFIPDMPKIEIDPELIFLVFLPPILYEAAVNNSWKELWRWRRIICSFAFVVVVITASVVAFIANQFIPGFSIALGFLLGGIVSPPDAVSAAAIMKFVQVPKRLAVLLEGESLFNDASSLIIVKFALIAVGTGQFVWYEAAGTFLWMVVGGVGLGVLISILFNQMHKILPMDENINTVFSLVTPYIMYISAEAVGASGVLAVVSGGLYFSYRSVLFIRSSSRLRAQSVWSYLIFLLNGFAFLLIGLDLPEIIASLKADGVSLWTAVGYGVLVTAALIVCRILCAYAAVVVTMVMGRFITVADRRNPGKGAPLILGWTGMRGVVSLAAALSIPLTVTGQQVAFPERSMILCITFIVILLTLVLQGLSLPVLLKHLHFPDFGDHLSEEETARIIRKGLAQTSIDYLKDRNLCPSIEQNKVINNMISHWIEQISNEEVRSLYGDARDIYISILEQQRLWLYRLNNENPMIEKEIIYHYIHRIDLEEERMLKE